MRIDWRDPDGRADGTVTTVSALRWTVAGLAVVALHAGGIWLALHWPAAAEPPGDPPAAIMMELAPLAVAPEVPQQDIAPGPQMEEAEEQVEPEKPVEEVEPEPPPQPKETEVKPPEPPKVEKAEVVLPAKMEPPKPKPKPKKKKQKKKAPRTTAPPSSQAQRADRAAAPAEGMSSSMSPASWKGALMAHLNRYKRFPPGAAGTGVATVAFTIDRSGRVLSARLVRSSGDGSLDTEAASLPRRASPVPAPPPNVGGRSVTLAVPIRFSR